MPPRQKKRGRYTPPDGVEAQVEAILAQSASGRVIYAPVKHFSPTGAALVRALIEEVAPAAVLVEGPEDATDLIPHIVHPDTRPPLTIFSFYLDRANHFGMNGQMTRAADVPARYRGWWPLTTHAPEYQALCAGARVGADLAFIDVPLTGTIPYHHVRLKAHERVTRDRHMAESRYFDALSASSGARDFEDFWETTFEIAGRHLVARDPRDYIAAMLTFAACTRASAPDGEAFEHDGTLVREAHMRYGIDRYLKNNPGEGKVVVVTGAFHSVALPWTRGKRAKIKKDRNLQTFLTVHSNQALSRLYRLDRRPAYASAVFEALCARDVDRPFDRAAMTTLIEVMHKARAAGEVLSTADAVGAFGAAVRLSRLRGRLEVGQADVEDAVITSYVKGDVRLRGAVVKAALEQALVGDAIGALTELAGQPPLFEDYYTAGKRLRLDLSGVTKTVRCDIHKQPLHRLKSAHLHLCDYLKLPMFGRLDGQRGSRGHFQGPNMVTGEGMHLITETWAVRWTVDVDDRLVQLGDRGATLLQVAASLLREELDDAAHDVAALTRLLLTATRMAVTELVEPLLDAVEQAVVLDWRFDHLAEALALFVVLHTFDDANATLGRDRLLTTIVAIYNRAALAIPQLQGTPPEQTRRALDLLQGTVRIVLSFDAVELDRGLLVEKLTELAIEEASDATLRGASYGILYSLGATREKVVARELDAYLLAGGERVRAASCFLEGLLLSAKSIVLGSRQLIETIDRVLAGVEWEVFKQMLPDLRRAFTLFIPSEIDDIAKTVADTLEADPTGPEPIFDAPIRAPLRAIGAAADARVSQALAPFLGGGGAEP